jgi:peptidoglycan/xylan/chitin deacetylase (PgdA/CDA1 family)
VSAPPSAARDEVGALVVSLDFELHWGVRPTTPPDAPYRANLLGAREAVPRMLELFERSGVAATWATVGLLFARSAEEARDLSPPVRPGYADRRLDPYGEPMGGSEEEDPLHFAGSLIEQVRRTPRQEVASHTFSHYYCLEPGQTAEAFEADLQSAVEAARRRGVRLRSMVFPRNQVNAAYLPLLRRAGFDCYRGPAGGWIYRAVDTRTRDLPLRRVLRGLDAYLPVVSPRVTPWREIVEREGLVDVPGSRFLRPFSRRRARWERVRLARIEREMRHAALRGGVYHLYWHPHNFGANLPENLAFLRRVLERFERLRDAHGMRSLTMAGVADAVRARDTGRAAVPAAASS